MRTSRFALAGVVALASVGFLPASAQAAAPPAPYTALTIDGGPASWWHQGSLVYDPTNGSTFTASATDTDQVDFRADQGADNWVFRLAPPTGSTWASGTEYDISLAPSATQAYVDVQHAGASCDEAPGKLHVRDVVRDGDGALTGFAASFLISCFSSYHDLRGELRWNSDAPYVAAATDVMSHNFGNHLVGSGPFTKTITVTSLGSAPVEYGAVSFYENSGSYAVTENTCSDTSREHGETCTVTVTANATKLGSDYTILKLADNTALGGRSVQIGMVGIDPRTATISPTTLYFDNETLYEVGTPQRVTVTSTGSSPITYSAARVTGADAGDFVITADGCAGQSLAPGQSCHVEVAAKPTGSGLKYGTLELPDDSLSSPKTVQLSISNARQGLRGTYTPVEPRRILDSRTGLGVRKGLVPAGGVVRLQVAGRGGVPEQGVSAVVLNVTVVDTQGNGHVTVYPTGVPRPTASSLNYPKNGLRSNSVTVQLSASGQVDIATNHGTHIIADVSGWYASSGYPSGYALGGQIQPMEPWRLFDSRSHWGEPLPGGAYTQLAVDFENLNSRIKAFIVNITAVNPASRGYLTAWDGANGQPPSTSTVNYFAGTVTPNFAIVPVGPCHLCTGEYYGVPSISVFSSVRTDVVVDVVGVVDDGTLPGGLRFEPRSPQRIVDSRQGQGVPGKLGGGVTRTVTTPASVLPADARALALNLTGVAPTANTYLKLWPTGVDRPDASTLNLAAGQTAANAAMALLGGTNLNQFNVYNNSGSIDVVADVVGAFWLYPGTASNLGAQDRRSAGAGAPVLRPAEPKPREFGTSTPRPRKL